jgi:hypothetical protein
VYTIKQIKFILDNYFTLADNKMPPDGAKGKASFIGDGLTAIVWKTDIDQALQSMGNWQPVPNDEDEVRGRLPRMPRHMRAVIEGCMFGGTDDYVAEAIGLRTMRDFLRGFCSVKRKVSKRGNSFQVSLPKRLVMSGQAILSQTPDGILIRFVKP